MKRIYFLALALLPILVFSFSGCYTQFEERHRSYYGDRDYRSDDDYYDSNNNTADNSDSSRSYSNDDGTVVNNYYQDTPDFSSCRRYFWGYYPSISFGVYSDSFYEPYFWDPFFVGGWCGTFYPYYYNYRYFYPDDYYFYHFGWNDHYGWNNRHDGLVYRYRDNNGIGRLRNSDGLRGSSITRNRGGRTDVANSINSRSRLLTNDRSKNIDRIGTLNRQQQRVDVSSRGASNNARNRSSVGGWNRDDRSSVYGNSYGSRNMNNNRTDLNKSRNNGNGSVYGRNGGGAVQRQNNQAGRNNPNVTNNPSNSGRNIQRDARTDTRQKNYFRQYSQDKRDKSLLRTGRKEGGKLYSTSPRNENSRRESSNRGSYSTQGRSQSAPSSSTPRSSTQSSGSSRGNSGSSDSNSRRTR
jgi:hypothetical protein